MEIVWRIAHDIGNGGGQLDSETSGFSCFEHPPMPISVSNTPFGRAAAKLGALLEAGVFDEWDIANASGSRFQIILSADWYLILAGNGFIQANPAAIGEAVKGGQEVWILTVDAVAAIYDWWRHYSSATSWMAGSFLVSMRPARWRT